MNRIEHLMTIGTEECVEVAQRLTKAQRFGLEQIQQDADDMPEQNPARLTNAARIVAEFYQLVAVLDMLGLLDTVHAGDVVSVFVPAPAIATKREKVERYLRRSAACGTFTEGEALAELEDENARLRAALERANVEVE